MKRQTHRLEPIVVPKQRHRLEPIVVPRSTSEQCQRGDYASAVAVFQPKKAFRLDDVVLVDVDPRSPDEGRPITDGSVAIRWVVVGTEILVRFAPIPFCFFDRQIHVVLLNRGREDRTVRVELTGDELEELEVVEAP